MTDDPSPSLQSSTRSSTTVSPLGEGLELLARRQGQLRRRPRVGDPIAGGGPRHRATAAADRAFLPRRPLPRRRGRDPAVPRHRHRPAHRRQHPRGRPTRSPPDPRIVYVDNDPLVLVHARALLTSTPEGATDYIDADLRDPETILAAAGRDPGLRPAGRGPAARRPGLHRRQRRGRAVIHELPGRCPSGSYLAITHPTDRDHRRTDRQGRSGPLKLIRHATGSTARPGSSPRSSTVSNSSSRAWSRARADGPRPTPFERARRDGPVLRRRPEP